MMPAERKLLNYDALTYRAYLVPAVTPQNFVLVPGPCVLWSIVTTSQGAAGYIWTLFDGMDASGMQLFSGTILAVQIAGIRLRCSVGLFWQGSGGASQSAWTITAAPIPISLFNEGL